MQQRAPGTVPDPLRDPRDQAHRGQRAALALRKPGLAHRVAVAVSALIERSIAPSARELCTVA